MAREERDREDLLNEATALTQRVELRIPSVSETAFIGFRREGAASIYWGQDEVYHFNTSNELRRGFLTGRLVKAEGGRLCWLDRHRSDGQSRLMKNELTDEEQREYLALLAKRLDTLRQCFAASDFDIVGQVPREANVVRCLDWLATLQDPIAIARRPGLQSAKVAILYTLGQMGGADLTTKSDVSGRFSTTAVGLLHVRWPPRPIDGLG